MPAQWLGYIPLPLQHEINVLSLEVHMSKTWRINPKKPGASHQVWAGPERSENTLPAKETDRHRAQRVALENRLKNLLGEENVTWNKRRYCYTAELTEEQAKEISLWTFVRGVVPQ